jgi:hypothetical protein
MNRNSKKIGNGLLLVSILFISVSCFGQKADLIKFLDAYKTVDLDESKKIVQDYAFDRYEDAEFDLAMSEYSTIDGLAFTTDLSNVKGYKAIINCKFKTETGGFIDKKILVVMYYDNLRKHYSVFGMREAVDPKHEYRETKVIVESGKYVTSKEDDYLWLTWWAIMAGQIKDAKKDIEIAISSAKKNGNISFSTKSIDVVLKRIL